MENPYQSGTYAPHAGGPAGVLTPGILQSLAATKPWVQFCSVLGFIGAGFFILIGLIMMAGGAVGGATGGTAAASMMGFQVMGGIMYLLFAMLYLIPSIKLWKYGSSIYRLLSGNSVADLENALEQQRGFWKFVGIMIIIGMALMVVAIIGMALVGVAAASALSP